MYLYVYFFPCSTPSHFSGLKSRVRDHYRSHQLSFWLQLVPQLHRAGKDAPEEHHHLENHNDWNSYRGFVRSEPVTRYFLCASFQYDYWCSASRSFCDNFV